MKWDIYVLKPAFVKAFKSNKTVPLTAWTKHPKRVKTCSYVKADKMAQKIVPGRVQFTRESE